MIYRNICAFLQVTEEEVKDLFFLFSFKDPEKKNKRILLLVGVLLTPITLTGAIFGYIHAYWLFLFHQKQRPNLMTIIPIVRLSMIIGAIGIWVVIILVILGFAFIAKHYPVFSRVSVIYLTANLLLSFIALYAFRKWRDKQHIEVEESVKFGSARFAINGELYGYRGKRGLYLGSAYTFADKGHIMTVAGTRGGKGVNLIIPNLLGVGGYEGSWVVIDPKGENAAITALTSVKAANGWSY